MTSGCNLLPRRVVLRLSYSESPDRKSPALRYANTRWRGRRRRRSGMLPARLRSTVRRVSCTALYMQRPKNLASSAPKKYGLRKDAPSQSIVRSSKKQSAAFDAAVATAHAAKDAELRLKYQVEVSCPQRQAGGHDEAEGCAAGSGAEQSQKFFFFIHLSASWGTSPM